MREEHRPLEGFIAPIESDFWKDFYPPNGWRCRCYVVQTAEPASTSDMPQLSDKDFPKEFRGNVGISGQVFKEDSTNQGKPHPYFALALDADSDTKKAFELSKLSAPYTEVYEAKNGAVVKVSPFTDESDLAKNLKSAIVIADNLGVSMNIRPHIIIEGYKNPEYEIKGNTGDRKESISYTGIKKNLEYAKAQGVGTIVYDITEFKNWLASDITKHLKGKIMNYKGADFLKEMYFINGNKAISFTKEELLKDYLKVIEKLKSLK